MKTKLKTGLENDRRENLHIHWGLKELLMILAFIATPMVGVINTMIKADNNAGDIIKIEADMDVIEEEINAMDNDINVNRMEIAVSANEIENVSATVKRIEALMIDFIRANGGQP